MYGIYYISIILIIIWGILVLQCVCLAGIYNTQYFCHVSTMENICLVSMIRTIYIRPHYKQYLYLGSMILTVTQ